MPEPQIQTSSEMAKDASATLPKRSSPIVKRQLSAFTWLVLLATLLAFPSHLTVLTYLIVLAIFACLALQQRSQAACASLIAGGLLAIKTPSNQYDFILLVAVFLVAGIIYFSKCPRRCWLAFAITTAVVAFFGIKRTLDTQPSQPITLDQRPIVCLGDSLTEGKHGGYPAELQKLVSQPVLNYGRNGFTTQMVIDKLLQQIVDELPQLVVVEIGGHDYNTGEPRDETKARLRQIIQTLVDADIEVVIVEIPRGFINDPFYGIERELTAEFDLLLIPDTIIRRFVFFSPMAPPGFWMDSKQHLSNDGLHPNERGQVEFAKVVADAIR